jgi:hypothetical protein
MYSLKNYKNLLTLCLKANNENNEIPLNTLSPEKRAKLDSAISDAQKKY